jgi:hypothetical protein
MLTHVPALFSTGGRIESRGGFADKATVLWRTLDGTQFHRLMEVGGLFDRAGDVDLLGSPFGLLLLVGTGFLAYRLRSREDHAGGWCDGRGFVLLTAVFVLVGTLALPGAVRAHHQLNVLPLTHLLVALALVEAWPLAAPSLGMKLRRGALVLLLAMLAVWQGAIRDRTWQLIEDTGGRGRWTHALHTLAISEDRPQTQFVSLDWGFHEPLLILTRQARLEEPIWQLPRVLQRGTPWIHPGDADTIYLVHDEPYDLFGLGPLLLAAAREADEQVEVSAHLDGEGQLAFYAIRIPRAHRLIFDGRFRIQ